MASQTRVSTGVIAFLATLSLLALVFFVLAIVMFANVQRLTNELAQKQAALDSAVRADEQDDRWESLKTAAKNKGVVRYLDTMMQDVTMAVSGSRRDDPAALIEKIKTASGENGTPLLNLLASRNDEITSLSNQLRSTEENRVAAQSDLQATVDRVRQLEEDHRATVTKLNTEIDTYKAGTTQYRDNVEQARTDMDTRVTTIRADSETTISGLESRVREMEQQLLIANDQLRRVKQEQSKHSLKGSFEGALVDGRIAGVNAPAREVYIDIGKRERVVLGMTFEVYTGSSKIQPGANGEYPAGKATIEVISIDTKSSTARILRENAGTPIISSDIIANAVYDPSKEYTFAVYGNFDTNNDNIATPQEIQDIKGLIENWNGKVSEDISGETDFLVLGAKPILPPQPKPSDPVELIQRYLLLKQQSTKYDELFEKATQAGIPILNQNRLYTLTGAKAGR